MLKFENNSNKNKEGLLLTVFNFGDCYPVLSLPGQRKNARYLIIGWNIQDKAFYPVEVEYGDGSSFVEPDGLVVFELNGLHDYVYVVVAAAEYAPMWVYKFLWGKSKNS